MEATVHPVPLHRPRPSQQHPGIPQSSPSCLPPVCSGLPHIPGSGSVRPPQHLPGMLQQPPGPLPSVSHLSPAAGTASSDPGHGLCWTSRQNKENKNK